MIASSRSSIVHDPVQRMLGLLVPGLVARDAQQLLAVRRNERAVEEHLPGRQLVADPAAGRTQAGVDALGRAHPLPATVLRRRRRSRSSAAARRICLWSGRDRAAGRRKCDRDSGRLGPRHSAGPWMACVGSSCSSSTLAAMPAVLIVDRPPPGALIPVNVPAPRRRRARRGPRRGDGYNRTMVAGIAAVGLGAACGAWLRWALSTWLNPRVPHFPLGTLAANLIGGYLSASPSPTSRRATISPPSGGSSSSPAFSAG